MILIGIQRQGAIKARLADLRFKEMQLARKLQDLSQYAANISDGILTPDEVASSSSALNGMHAMFMRNSMMQALPESWMNFNGFMQMHGQQMMQTPMGADPSMGMQMNPMMIHMQFFKQSLEKYAKQEEKKIHVEEKKIQAEKLKIEQQIKMLETELQSIEKATDKSISQSAPKFGLQG